MAAFPALVATDPDQQRGGAPPERLVSQPTQDAVAGETLATASSAPLVGFNDPAQQHRPIRVESLPDRDESELVQAREGRQVRSREGSVAHVEVFQMSV
jgi:hypothetical protein